MKPKSDGSRLNLLILASAMGAALVTGAAMVMLWFTGRWSADEVTPTPSEYALNDVKLQERAASEQVASEHVASQQVNPQLLNEPIAAYEQILAARRKVFGGDSKMVLDLLSTIADLHERNESFPQAHELRRERLAELTRQHGENHYLAITAKVDLANSELLARLTSGQRKELTEAKALEANADTLSARGKFADALQSQRRCVEIEIAILGSDHQRIALGYDKLVNLHVNLKEFGRAEGYANQSMLICRRLYGDSHPQLANAYNWLGVVVSERNATEGIAYYNQAKAIWQTNIDNYAVEYGTVLNNLALLSVKAGDDGQAEKMFRESIETLERSTDSRATLMLPHSLLNQGDTLQRLNRLPEAEIMFRRALTLRETLVDHEHPDYTVTLARLANLAQAQGYSLLEKEDFDAARTAYQQMIDWRIRANGESHYQIIHDREVLKLGDALRTMSAIDRAAWHKSVRDLSKLEPLRKQQKSSEALVLAQEIVQVSSRILGPTNLNTVIAQLWIGALSCDTHDYVTAETSYREALKQLVEQLAPTDQLVDSTRDSLITVYGLRADVALKESQFDLAIADMQHQVELLSERHGEKHWKTTDARLRKSQVEQLKGLTTEQRQQIKDAELANGEGNKYFSAGHYQEAKISYEQAVQLVRAAHGGDQYVSGAYLASLGRIASALGDQEQAETCLQQALAILKNNTGTEHPTYADYLIRFGGVFLRKGDVTRAEALLLEAVEIIRRVSGESSRDLIAAYSELGDVYGRKGDAIRQELYLRQSLELNRQFNGEHDRAYAVGLHNLSIMFSNRREFDRAESLLRQSLELQRQVRGEGHPTYTMTMTLLADVLFKQNKLPEAVAMMNDVLELRTRVFGENHPVTVATVPQLTNLLDRQVNALCRADDFSEAKKLAAQSIALRVKYSGENHWQTGDARLNLHKVERRESLGPDQRKIMVDADQALTEIDNLILERKFADAKSRLIKLMPQVEEVSGKNDPLCMLLYNRLGNRFYEDKDANNAEAMYRRQIALTEELQGIDHPYYATALANLAGVAELRKNYDEAERLSLEALERRRKTRDRQHGDTFASLEQLGNLYDRIAIKATDEGQFEKAVTAQQNALKYKLERWGEADFRTTDARLLLERAQLHLKLTPAERKELEVATEWVAEGETLRNQEKFEPAFELHKKAVDVRTRILGLDDRRTWDALWCVGMDLEWDDEGHKAEPIYRDLVAWRTKVLGEWHPDTAAALYRLGRVHLTAESKFDQAEQELLKSLEISKRAHGTQTELYAMVLSNLASIAHSTGYFSRAESLGRQTLDIFRVISGEKSYYYAAALKKLAKTYHALGDYARAEPMLKQSIELTRSLRKSTTAETYELLGRLYVDLGDHARAEAAFREAHAIYLQVFGEAHKNTTNTTLLLGDVARHKGNLDEAETQYRVARDHREKLVGKTSSAYAETLEKLALIRCDRKDYEQAEALASEAHEIRQKENVSGLLIAHSMMKLAEIRELRDNHEGAAVLMRQALVIRGRYLGLNHPLYAEVLRALGQVERKLGNEAGAAAHLNQGLNIVRASLMHAADSQSERQQLLMAQSLRGYLDDYLSLTLATHAPAETSYQHVLSWKGTVFARQLHARELRAAGKDADPELLKLYTQLEATTARLAMFRFTAPDPKEASVRVAEVKQLDEELERLETELSKRSADFRDRKAREALTPEMLKASLPADAALIDFLEFNYTGPSTNNSLNWITEKRLAGFILRPGQPIEVIDLGASQPISASVDHWRLTLQRKTSTTGDNDPAMAISRMIWQPLAKHLKSVKTVLISPDGALCRLPFAALPGDKPGTYLIEDTAVAVIPVPQLLPELLDSSGQLTDEVPALLLMGNVDYGATPGEATERSESRSAASGSTRSEFRPLEATAGEILVVRKHFEKRFREGRANLVEESDATENHFRLNAPRHQWLHLATHGFFSSPTGPKHGSSRTSATTEDDPIGHHPGLFTGLAMAGANAPVDPNADDGILTALEVAQVDLRRVQLAVLSACETGLGEDVGGEGVLGLQRAFQVAGARGVMASLWSVDDNATRALMERFYENLWKKKMPRLEAMRDAQLWMLQEGHKRGMHRVSEGTEENAKPRTPPYYWAAFILSGDWR